MATNSPSKRCSYSLTLALLAFSCLSSSVVGFSVGASSSIINEPIHENNAALCSSRRDWMATILTTTASTTAAVTAFGLPSPALASDASKLRTFDDPTHGFSIEIPQDWVQTKSELQDRRTIVVWTDPADPKTALFIAYTPVRDDFTSLASFGAVDTVAAQTILPKGALANVEGVEAKMISAESKKQAYIFDYYQSIENVQPPTHFRTIFTLQQGATGGAGAVLVTITLQAPEEKYKSSLKPIFDTIIESYGKSKSKA